MTQLTDHESMPEPGTVYSVAGPNTGLQANLLNGMHYPVEAICTCGEMIYCARKLLIGKGGEWIHLGRLPGETAADTANRTLRAV